MMCLLTGCSRSIITAAHVTQPVMIGGMHKVHALESDHRQNKEPFDIPFPSSLNVISNANEKEIENMIRETDLELIKRIHSPQDEVIIEEIRVGCGWWVFEPRPLPPWGSQEIYCETSISGAIYSSQKGDNEKP